MRTRRKDQAFCQHTDNVNKSALKPTGKYEKSSLDGKEHGQKYGTVCRIEWHI